MIGYILLLAMATMLIWMNTGQKEVCIKGFSVKLPFGIYSYLQLVAAIIDLLAAIYSCYVLLPADLASGYSHFLLIYIGAVLFGMASHAPGGIGVFEATVIAAMAATGRADLLAALLLYRIIYNITPFCIAATIFMLREIRLRSVG
jgi:phosphatidylglycerol lysyltransferase